MLKKILIFCFFTLLIGSIYIYPDIRFIAEEGKDFKGITLTGTGDEAFYLAKLNAVYKGDLSISSIGLYEHRKDIGLIPPFYEIAVGSIGKNLNIPVPYLDIILSFVFPVMIFWLIYILIYSLSRSLILGILGASCILLGYSLFTKDFNIFKQIMCFQYSEPLWFLRPYSPQAIYLPFVLILILAFRYIDTAKIRKLILMAALMALLNYLHTFLWMFLFAGLAVWFLIALLKKQTIVYKNTAFVLFVSFFLSIPYWINCYRISLSPDYAFYQQLFGTELSHRPILPVSYLLLGSIILLLNRKSDKKVFYFLLSFLIGGIICLNQQIITGKIVGPVYFLNYAGKTFLIVALAASLGNIVNFKKYAARVFFALLIGFLFFSGLIQQNNYYNANRKIYSDLQPLRGAVTWLNDNTEKDDVILTDSIKSHSFVFVRTLLLYTKNYHYLGFEIHSMISREELEHRILSAMRFYEYSPEEAEDVFETAGGIIFFGLSSNYGITKDREIDDYNLRLGTKYKNMINKDPVSLLKRYKVDYVLIGKKDHLFNDIESKYPALKKVFYDGEYKILKFDKI